MQTFIVASWLDVPCFDGALAAVVGVFPALAHSPMIVTFFVIALAASALRPVGGFAPCQVPAVIAVGPALAHALPNVPWLVRLLAAAAFEVCCLLHRGWGCALCAGRPACIAGRLVAD
jgi:hypothetical protein